MRRVLAVVALVVALAGCGFTQASLTTPSTPLTYGWVMAHHWQEWGVQIGPKNDGSGTHVAIYAWRDCPTSGRCAWEFFQEYDALEPGSTHDYAVVWTAAGWSLIYDGRTLATLNPGGPVGAIYETNPGERTAG